MICMTSRKMLLRKKDNGNLEVDPVTFADDDTFSYVIKPVVLADLREVQVIMLLLEALYRFSVDR
jgi:hypothetical protein